MEHECKLIKDDNKTKLEACCQYGVDVDLGERDNILARSAEIKAILDEDVRDAAWFNDTESEDKDFPSGRFVRTKTHDKGCIFLSHDKRGCSIHRASIEGGWDFHGTKPHVCRLFPVSYETDSVVVSDDYQDYSCSQDPDAPTLYRVARSDLGQIFGDELVEALDKAEAQVSRSRLSLVS